MSISEEKKRIRSIVHQRKAAMTSEEIIDSDIKIQENIIKLEEIRSAGTVFCFVSMKDEIDTKPVIEKLLEQGKKVGVPRCIEGNNLRVYNIRSFDDLKKGFFGIEEPLESCDIILPQEIDAAVIPCTSCDRKGHRLGKGGGYYDRYLADARFSKIVICREKLMLDEVVTDKFDVAMDIVVTESETIRI